MALAYTDWISTSNKEFITNEIDCRLYSEFFDSVTNTKERNIKYDTEEELNIIYNECSEDNWDFDGAIGISNEIYLQAKRFIKFINNVPKPEVVPYPNGLLGFDWKTKKHDISLVFDKNNKFCYAIFSKNGKKFGTEEQNDYNQSIFIKLLEDIFNEI